MFSWLTRRIPRRVKILLFTAEAKRRYDRLVVGIGHPEVLNHAAELLERCVKLQQDGFVLRIYDPVRKKTVGILRAVKSGADREIADE